MKPNTSGSTLESNLQGEVVQMGLDPLGTAHLMGILAGLYSDSGMAVVREYSTNAWDSHVEAGVSRPIEVTTPTALSCYFRVRDYGVGLSIDDIRRIYSQYGASTKRESDTQTGMLGVGSKSALSFASQFSIDSRKDGRRILVSVSRNPDGSGSMTIVHEEDTEESNGVEIVIPATIHNGLREKAEKFFSFWKPGTVLLDGKDPSVQNDFDLGDGIYIREGLDHDFIVMGNVAYPVNTSLSSMHSGYNSRRMKIVAEVPMGAVDFVPSREELHYTSRTKTAIANVSRLVSSRMDSFVQTNIASAASHAEAAKRLLQWRNILGTNVRAAYKGQAIPSYLETSFILYRPDVRGGSYHMGHMRLDDAQKMAFAYNFHEEKLTHHHKAKLRLWAELNGFHGPFAVFRKQPDFTWFTPDNAKMIASWDDIQAIKRPSKPRAPKADQTYHVWEGYGTKAHKILPPGDHVIVWSPADRQIAKVMKSICSLEDKVVSVRLEKNRWSKFFRDHPGAVTVEQYLKGLLSRRLSELSEDDKLYLSMHSLDKSFAVALDPAKLDDPELIRYSKVARSTQSTEVTNFITARRVAGHCGYDSSNMIERETPMTERYPLIFALQYSQSQSVVEAFHNYANQVYKEKNANHSSQPVS